MIKPIAIKVFYFFLKARRATVLPLVGNTSAGGQQFPQRGGKSKQKCSPAPSPGAPRANRSRETFDRPPQGSTKAPNHADAGPKKNGQAPTRAFQAAPDFAKGGCVGAAAARFMRKRLEYQVCEAVSTAARMVSGKVCFSLRKQRFWSLGQHIQNCFGIHCPKSNRFT